MSEWRFAALLPNLRLKQALGNETMLMVPYDDTRAGDFEQGKPMCRVSSVDSLLPLAP